MIPTLIEIFIIDPLLWHNWNLKKAFKKNATPQKSDKPVSTRMWIVLVVLIGVLIQFVLRWNWAASYMLLAWAFRVALFSYIMNLSSVGKRQMHLFYLSNKGYDKWLKNISVGSFVILRIFWELSLLTFGVLQFLYFAGIIYQGNNILFDLPVFTR